MSVYVSHVYPDRVEVLADTGVWDRNTLACTSILPKIIAIRDMPLVMTGRGGLIHLGYLGAKLAEMAGSGSVDEAVGRFQIWLYEQTDIPQFDQGADIIVAGWSETTGAFHMRADLSGDRALEPFRSDFMAGIAMTGAAFKAAGFKHEGFADGLRDEGVRMLRAMRAHEQYQGGKPLVACGGTVQLATITAGGVAVEAAGGWPDLLGVPMKRDAPWLEPTMPQVPPTAVGPGGYRSIFD